MRVGLRGLNAEAGKLGRGGGMLVLKREELEEPCSALGPYLVSEIVPYLVSGRGGAR